jgi:hypothetical protein
MAACEAGNSRVRLQECRRSSYIHGIFKSWLEREKEAARRNCFGFRRPHQLELQWFALE